MEKKIYVKPSISVIELENGCSILAGSLGTSEGRSDGTTPLSFDEDMDDDEIIKFGAVKNVEE